VTDSYERFHWALGNAIAHGPDAAERLKERHARAVQELAKVWEEPDAPFLSLTLDSQYGGRFFDTVIEPGPHKPSYSRKYAEARIWIGFPLNTIELDDEQFRQVFSEHLLDGTALLLRYLEKRRVHLDAPGVLLRVEEIVRRYNQLSFPLPPSPHEANVGSWYESRRLFEERGHKATLPAFSKVSFYIYFKSRRSATSFSSVLAEQSYSCEVSGEGRSWLCLVKLDMTEREALEAEESRIGNLAAELGGDLDGWDVE
jgi:hypothetical protein